MSLFCAKVKSRGFEGSGGGPGDLRGWVDLGMCIRVGIRRDRDVPIDYPRVLLSRPSCRPSHSQFRRPLESLFTALEMVDMAWEHDWMWASYPLIDPPTTPVATVVRALGRKRDLMSTIDEYTLNVGLGLGRHRWCFGLHVALLEEQSVERKSTGNLY